MAKNKNSLSWHASEFKEYEKNLGWYIALVACAILIMGFFVIVQKDFFAAITIGILTIMIVFFARQKPQVLEIQLNNKGVYHGQVHIPYKQIKRFWIVDKHPHRTLNLETSTYLNRLMILELDEQDPDEVREFLLEYLPEHEDSEPTFAQRVIHWFKF